MGTPWKELAERVVRARPTSDDDARRVLEWVAEKEGKSVPQLVQELDVGWAWRDAPKRHRY